MNKTGIMNDNDRIDYEQTLAYFHALHDVRFTT